MPNIGHPISKIKPQPKSPFALMSKKKYRSSHLEIKPQTTVPNEVNSYQNIGHPISKIKPQHINSTAIKRCEYRSSHLENQTTTFWILIQYLVQISVIPSRNQTTTLPCSPSCCWQISVIPSRNQTTTQSISTIKTLQISVIPSRNQTTTLKALCNAAIAISVIPSRNQTTTVCADGVGFKEYRSSHLEIKPQRV